MAEMLQVKAGGDIGPSRFVSIGAADNTVIESNADDIDVVGISQEGVKDAPGNGGSTEAAESGDNLMIYPPGSKAIVELGTGGCTRGTYGMPDADGKAIAGTTGKPVFCLFFESGSAGEFVEVLVTPRNYEP